MVSSLDHCPWAPSTDPIIARTSADAVDFPSKSPTCDVTILIPVTLARCWITAGSPSNQSGPDCNLLSGAMEAGQRASFRRARIMLATIKQSEHSSTYSTSTFEGGCAAANSALNFFGSTILGIRSLCSSSLASSARAFASAVSFRSCSDCFSNSAAFSETAAIFSFACSLSKSQWCSLTIPIHTMATVAAAPATRLATNAKLALSNIQPAHSKDGQGWFSVWFAISAIIALAVIGGTGMLAIWKAIQRR